MTLRDWMLSKGLDDAAVAERIGGLSPLTVRALRLRTRGPSIATLARVFEITGGAVLPPDMLPLKSSAPQSGRAGSLAGEPCPS